jgi:hypothetical protein
MAAKIEWQHGALLLGTLIVGRVTLNHGGWNYAISSAGGESGGPYESMTDAKQDAESEVRRLLKAAGVDVA